jgi:fructokinase
VFAVPRAICIGELLIDFVSTTTDTTLADCPGFHKAPGGAPANVAVGLAKLGVSSGFIGKVGDDPFGEFLRKMLEAVNVDTTYLLTGENVRTTLAFVATRSDGKKDIAFWRNPGADMMLEPEEIDLAYVTSAQVFHYGSISLSKLPSREATMRAIQMARKNGLLMSYDPNLRLSLWDSPEEAKRRIWEVMPYAQVVKCAEEEWKFITDTEDFEEGAAEILKKGPSLVVVTRGADGCYFDNGTARGELPSFPVEVADTLGAGDGFVAGMLSQSMKCVSLSGLKETELRDILTYASACGALTCTKVGVIPALPTAKEVERFLTSKG